MVTIEHKHNYITILDIETWNFRYIGKSRLNKILQEENLTLGELTHTWENSLEEVGNVVYLNDHLISQTKQFRKAKKELD